MDGSRYEHWRPLPDKTELVAATRTASVQWLRGEAPEVAYLVARCGRVLAVRRPSGGVRPLVLAHVLRRMGGALRECCVVPVRPCANAAGVCH